MDWNALADLLFPEVTGTIAELEARFPQRNLPEGAKVTLVAPSPTGFMHLGNLFSALVGERLAHQSNGVFFLRIEDRGLVQEFLRGAFRIQIKTYICMYLNRILVRLLYINDSVLLLLSVLALHV